MAARPSSWQPDHLVCLICGKKQKLLKRHLAVEHELTPNQYRDSFELKPEYPMAAPDRGSAWSGDAVRVHAAAIATWFARRLPARSCTCQRQVAF
jgi:predicted transcriptional regulator